MPEPTWYEKLSPEERKRHDTEAASIMIKVIGTLVGFAFLAAILAITIALLLDYAGLGDTVLAPAAVFLTVVIVCYYAVGKMRHFFLPKNKATN